MRIPRLRMWTRPPETPARPDLESRPICVLHIMKTAGTTLRSILEDDLGGHAIYPNAGELARREHGWYPQATEVLDSLPSLRPHAVLIGHFPAAILDRLPGRYRGAVVLRDPVQRALSALAHMARMHATVPARLVDDERMVGRLVRDYQTKILGCPDVQRPNFHDRVDDATLDAALDRVATLPFVGITERFHDSCRLFDATFGTHTARFDRQLNVLRATGNEHAELIPAILPHVQRDLVLYEHALRRFENDLAGVAAEPAGTRPSRRVA
jgi:hypothetical protein